MKTAERFEEMEICDNRAKIEVSPDGMYATVIPLTDGFLLPSPEELTEILSECGIVYGIVSAPQENERGWIVAKGTAPVAGEDGRVEIVAKGFCKKLCEKDEKNEARCVDPKLRNIIVNVRKGEKVARKLPPGKGNRGFDVMGREIPATPGKWVAFHPGSGVEVADEEFLISTVNGCLSLEGDVISVLEDLEIDSSVDMSTGHINFCGKSLHIAGSINSGFKVFTRGDLVIEGNIEDETVVDVGGDLVVKGIIRAKKTVVKARGNIECGAVEYAEIGAGKSLSVKEYVLDALCKAGGDVDVTAGKGLVAGGKIFLGGSFAGRLVGTPAYVPTMIHAGFNPHIKETFDKYVSDLEDYAAKREELASALAKLDLLAEKRGGLSAKFANLRNEIRKGLSNIDCATSERKKEIEALEAQIGRSRASVVVIKEKVYPSTTIRIANAATTLKRMVESVRFQFRKGQVVLTTL